MSLCSMYTSFPFAARISLFKPIVLRTALPLLFSILSDLAGLCKYSFKRVRRKKKIVMNSLYFNQNRSNGICFLGEEMEQILTGSFQLGMKESSYLHLQTYVLSFLSCVSPKISLICSIFSIYYQYNFNFII